MILATLDDLPLIREALLHHEPALRARGFVVSPDLETACSALRQEIAKGNGYIIGDFLVMVDVITPWYSTEKVLQEWFTMSLRLKPHGVSTIAGELVTVAKQRRCSLVMTGDASTLLAPVWEGSGMKPCGKSFFRKVS